MAAVTLTKNNFMEEVLSSEQPVLIDFWAPWCGPCRMLSPVVDEIAEELSGRVKICKVNVDEESDLAAQFRVMSIPMLAVIKNGELSATVVGVRPKTEILKLLEE